MSDRRDEYDPFFLDLAKEGAQFGLLCLMTGISEECWAVGWMNGSGWMNNLEHYLWRVAQGGERGYGMQTITERQATLLKLLSEEADGWWVWDDDGPRFISLTAWQAKRASLTSPGE